MVVREHYSKVVVMHTIEQPQCHRLNPSTNIAAPARNESSKTGRDGVCVWEGGSDGGIVGRCTLLHYEGLTRV